MTKLLSLVLSLMMVLSLFSVTGTVAASAEGTLAGKGTEKDPYQIGSAADWNTFAEWINSGTNADKYYRQTADIEGVSTTVGLGTATD